MNARQYFVNWYWYGYTWLHLREVKYKPGWSPLKFAPVLASTYLVGAALGLGVVSVSRSLAGTKLGNLVDWFFDKVLRQGPRHCELAGPVLWGSKSAWNS